MSKQVEKPLKGYFTGDVYQSGGYRVADGYGTLTVGGHTTYEGDFNNGNLPATITIQVENQMNGLLTCYKAQSPDGTRIIRRKELGYYVPRESRWYWKGTDY